MRREHVLQPQHLRELLLARVAQFRGEDEIEVHLLCLPECEVGLERVEPQLLTVERDRLASGGRLRELVQVNPAGSVVRQRCEESAAQVGVQRELLVHADTQPIGHRRHLAVLAAVQVHEHARLARYVGEREQIAIKVHVCVVPI